MRVTAECGAVWFITVQNSEKCIAEVYFTVQEAFKSHGCSVGSHSAFEPSAYLSSVSIRNANLLNF